MSTTIDLSAVLESHRKWLRSEAGGAKADLRGADLRCADLRYANLRGADLRDAKLNWQSHALLSEILLRAAGDSVERRMLAGLVAVSTDWCWGQWLSLEHTERAWAITELAKWVRPDDGAPEVIRAASRAAVP